MVLVLRDTKYAITRPYPRVRGDRRGGNGETAGIRRAAVGVAGTLGVGRSSTLGSGTGTVGLGDVIGSGVGTGAGGATLGSGEGSVSVEKTSASCWMAARWALPRWAYGVAGWGCVSACVNAFAASTTLSAEKVLGMAYLEGKHSTVWATHSLCVLGTYKVWQR